jgi:hypothetical protein
MKDMKKIVITLMICAFIAMQSCYTSKPTGYAGSPDYNKRVEVINAGMKKKSNGMNVVFTASLAGAGGFAGYQYLPLVQKQTATGQESVRAANAAIGALSGAALAYLCNAIAGKNKITPVFYPQQWIEKANPQYRLLNGANRNFTLIHSSSERNFAVRNLQDVRDFKSIFPESSYEEDVVKQGLAVFTLADIKTLSGIYPKYSDRIKARYVQLSLTKSTSFTEFKNKIALFPESIPEIDLKINYEDELQLKKLFAQFDAKEETMGKKRIRTYKNEILDKLRVIRTDIDFEYETAQYEKLPKSDSDYNSFYSFIRRFPNSKYSVDLKTKADNLRYNEYSSLFAQIQQEANLVNTNIENNSYVSVTKLENLLASYERFDEKFKGYDPDNLKSEIAAAQSTVKEGRILSVFYDIKQNVNSILTRSQNREFVSSSDLSANIGKFNNLPGNKLPEMKQYVADAQQLCRIIEGINLNVPGSYREFSGSGAILGLIGTLWSGNVRAMNLATPMNTELAEEHLAKVRIIDLIAYFIEQNRFGEDELLGHASKYDENNVWRIFGYKLVDKENAIITAYNNDANNKMSKFLDQWQTNIDNSSSYSSSSSSSNQSSGSGQVSNICDNIETDNIPGSNEIVWEEYGDLVDGCEITFTDGTKGTLFRSRESGKKYQIPYVDVGSSNLYYNSAEYARQALYIYKKCPEGPALPKNWREKGSKHIP